MLNVVAVAIEYCVFEVHSTIFPSSVCVGLSSTCISTGPSLEPAPFETLAFSHSLRSRRLPRPFSCGLVHRLHHGSLLRLKGDLVTKSTTTCFSRPCFCLLLSTLSSRFPHMTSSLDNSRSRATTLPAVFVEALDKCFENVCELDLIFHSDKVLLNCGKGLA